MEDKTWHRANVSSDAAAQQWIKNLMQAIEAD
jgi:hypothetical protein